MVGENAYTRRSINYKPMMVNVCGHTTLCKKFDRIHLCIEILRQSSCQTIYNGYLQFSIKIRSIM